MAYSVLTTFSKAANFIMVYGIWRPHSGDKGLKSLQASRSQVLHEICEPCPKILLLTCVDKCKCKPSTLTQHA